jgi:hypothetical protein
VQKTVNIYNPTLTNPGERFSFASRSRFSLSAYSPRYVILPTLAKARECYVTKMRLAIDPWDEEAEVNKRRRVGSDRVKLISHSKQEEFYLPARHSKKCVMSVVNEGTRDPTKRRMEFIGRHGYLKVEDINYYAKKGITNNSQKERRDLTRISFNMSRELEPLEQGPVLLVPMEVDGQRPPSPDIPQLEPVEEQRPPSPDLPQITQQFGQLFMTRDEAEFRRQMEVPTNLPIPEPEHPVYLQLEHVETDPEMPSLYESPVYEPYSDENSGSAQTTPLGHNAQDIPEHEELSGDAGDYERGDWRKLLNMEEEVEKLNTPDGSVMSDWEQNLTPPNT